MAEAIAGWLSVACLTLAIIGGAYVLMAALILPRSLRMLPESARPSSAVTILKPLHGAESGLYENLASFCVQDYPHPIQILFGVQDAADPAITVVQKLIADYPALDLELVVDSRVHGPNRKVSNLTNLQTRIKHELVILADSDMRVARNYLAQVASALQREGVGIVTCLYRGVAAGGFWARMAVMAIDCHFLPSVLVGLRIGLARPCFGSTIALRRSVLARIGGFEVFARYLADDNAMGEAVRRAGMEVAILPVLVTHACTERTFVDLWRHALRSARTIRVVAPWGFAGSVVTHPLALGLLGVLLADFDRFALTVLAAVALCRLVLQSRVDHTLLVSPPRWWLSLLGDLFSFAAFVASFFITSVSWRGHRYKVLSDGTLVSLNDAGR
ncbi:MAG TPA: bacteriohopanetetrol glucosamine biosynthesis glycosyltransferase HpnI [Burkholderiales bacterium]|nr:bacteriohopanetetrol glucosamine biosynthesis glycosyltransferase HpnI [Burkholderiales bacterium]